MKKVTTEDFIQKAKLVHGDRYDYSLTEYKKSKNKVKIKCDKHGAYEQNPNNHLNGKGCPKCAGFNKTTDDFIQNVKLIHGEKYNYSLVKYRRAFNKIKIICPVHGEFGQTPDSHLSGSGCPICSNNILFTTEQFIMNAKQKHLNKYDYSLVTYKGNKNKVKIICPIHGEFEQKAGNHLRGDGCAECTGNKKLTTEKFIKRAKEIHNDKYDYSLVNYKNNSKKIKIICLIHGEFEQNPNNHLNGNGCPSCKESKGEKEIRNFLIENNIEFIPQHKFSDCKNKLPLPFDFYLPEYNMCIEFNGRQHYEPVSYFGGEIGLIETMKRDQIKVRYCYHNNISLFIFKYNESLINKLKRLIHPKS